MDKPRMTEGQLRRARQLIRRLCAKDTRLSARALTLKPLHGQRLFRVFIRFFNIYSKEFLIIKVCLDNISKKWPQTGRSCDKFAQNLRPLSLSPRCIALLLPLSKIEKKSTACDTERVRCKRRFELKFYISSFSWRQPALPLLPKGPRSSSRGPRPSHSGQTLQP